MKVVIVEDEIVAAESLKGLLQEIEPDIEILSILQSIDESTEWFESNAMPNLVFMDIHLADGSSFSIFEEVEITCPVIFITAYDEYALKAFQVNGIAYLLKPISKEELSKAILKYKSLSSSNTGNKDAIQQVLESLKLGEGTYKNHFLIPSKDKLLPLKTDEIAYIFLENKILKAITFKGESFYLENYTLAEISETLNPSKFFRANRQYIIAHKAIKDISIWFGNKLSVNLNTPTPEKIVISKVRVSEFKEWYTQF